MPEILIGPPQGGGDTEGVLAQPTLQKMSECVILKVLDPNGHRARTEGNLCLPVPDQVTGGLRHWPEVTLAHLS